MNAVESIGPISLELTIECSPDDAFDRYTDRIGEWWDPQYTANPDSLASVTIEPRIGGRIYATHSDMGEHDWGEVKTWEPGRLLVHSFTLAQDANHPTEVMVVFLDDPFSISEDGIPQRCVLDFEHRGWTSANADVREKFGDWGHILSRFKAFAESAGK